MFSLNSVATDNQGNAIHVGSKVRIIGSSTDFIVTRINVGEDDVAMEKFGGVGEMHYSSINSKQLRVV